MLIHFFLDNYWMIESLFPTHSIILVYLQTSVNKIFRFLGYCFRIAYSLAVNCIYELDLVISRPRSSSMKHFIVNQANRPQIRFVGVFCFFQELRWHIKRRSDNGSHDRVLIFQVFCEAEIANFALFIFDEYICWLQIAMNNPLGI